MEANQRKRIIISAIYVVLFALFFWYVFSKIYAWVRPAETCFDAVKSQNEEGVDCGGTCQQKCAPIAGRDLNVLASGFVDGGATDRYDLYGEIENPNNGFGASRFQYAFTLKDAGGQVIAVRSGTEFILPGERKYIVENNIESAALPASAELEIKDPQWMEFKDYENPQLKIINKNYTEISSGVGFSEATGLLRNESPFDWSAIRIKVVLKDPEGKIIALNSTELNTVRSGESREFRAFWPAKFSGTVGNMDVQAEVNVFDSDSFVKRYAPSQKFQQYE